MNAIQTALKNLVSAPASARPLAVFRIGLAAVLLVQALLFAGNLLELYGSRGIVQWSVLDPGTPDYLPRIGWVADALAPLGVSEARSVQLVFLTYVTSLACLLFGWRTRAAAVVAWLTHLMMNLSGRASIYGVDQFAHIGLFYCVWMPVGHALSADVQAGRVRGGPSAAARLALRVLQIHLSIVYLSSGVEKATGIQWWNGEAIWRAVMRPDLAQFDFTWLAEVPWLAMLICWGTLLVELGYAVLAWPKWTRTPMVLATVGMHAGIAVVLGLWTFSAVMIVLNVAAFLVPADPQAEPRGLPALRLGERAKLLLSRHTA
jgi:hypothetical protein